MNDNILVSCRNEKIRYNAYNLVKAFFPESNVKSMVSEDSEHLVSAALPSGNSAGCDHPEPVNLQADDIRELYEVLRKATGKDLPWGMLTGVRPVKLAFSWIEKNMSRFRSCDEARAAFTDWFYEDRFVSPQKAALAFDIAMREKGVLAGCDDPDHYSVYISVPFCPSVCSYCSFSSGSIASYAGRIKDYVDAVAREMKAWVTDCGSKSGRWPDTVYIGGGTPTSLDEEMLERLLFSIEDIFHVKEGLAKGRIREYTVEAGRPDSITGGKLGLIRKYGGTRISINPQTMQQKTLEVIGRRHTPQQTVEAFTLARKMGFDNINMDLILGLPSETNEDVRDTLNKIRVLSPDSLTVHCLAVKRSSSMGIGARTGAGNEGKAAGDIARMVSDAGDAAGQMGLQPYYLYRQKCISGNFENTGYAKPGKEGLYNIIMMEEVHSIAAFGAAAASKLVLAEPTENPERNGQLSHILRKSNPKDPDEYIKRHKTIL